MKTLSTILFASFCSVIAYSQSPYIHHTYEKISTPDLEAPIDFIDFDNDGDEDLMNFSTNYTIRIYRSNGSWIDSLDYVDVPYNNSVIHADWNNDNLPDLLCNDASFQLIENTGNFTFAPYVEISPSGSYNIDTAHINADSYVDAFSLANYSIQLFINQSGAPSTANYTIMTPYSMSIYNTEVLFNDIENDGLTEMFVKAKNDKIYIYTQTGTMNYTLQDSIVSSDIGNVASGSLYFEDLNNDGHKELITRDGWYVRVFEWTSGYNYSLMFSGNATYSVGTGFGIAGLFEISDFYDVDQNGFLDIVVGNSVFFNNNNFTFNEVEINTTARLYEANYKCTDIDNNGKTDICYVYNPANTQYNEAFYRSENTSAQVIDPKSLIWYLWTSSSYQSDVLDYDNDGDQDKVSYNLGKLILWENINDTLYPKYGGQALSYWTEFINVVDINQDSFLDVIWSAAGLPNDQHGFRLNNGSDMNSATFLTSSNMHLKLIADIDNDGIDELFYHLKSGTTSNYVYMYRLNTGTPVLAATVLYWTDINVDDVVVRLGDYDFDGLKDIVIQHENSGYYKVRMVHNNGSDTFSAGQIIANSTCNELLGIFDTNADQYPDLIWHNGGTRIYRSINNAGTFATPQIHYTLPSGSFSSSTGFPTDYNNDYLTDLIVQSDTYQWIFKNNGFGLNLAHSEPATKRISRIRDMDNDGDEDVSAFDTWYENTSNSAYHTSGSVFYDVNTNGIFDQGIDVMFPSFPVDLNNNALTTYTDTAGYFHMPLGSVAGSYNIAMGSSYATQFNATTVPYPSIATVNSGAPNDSVSIGVTNINNIVDGTLDVTLSGNRCNEQGRLFLNVQNFSPENVDIEIKVKLAANSSFAGSNLPVTQIADTLIWQLSGVNPFELENFYADINMPSTTFMSDTMHFYSSANFTGSLGSQLIADTINQILTCAYDPNDKNITMSDFVYLGDSTYSFTDDTEYLIRFQNTGNDTAVNIVLLDYVSDLFDWSTIRPVSASHSYNLTVDSNGLLKVEFNNIQLPDSSVNFLGSMGYFKFKVDYASTSATFVPVNNFALILFDQNPPIITNVHEFFRVNCIDFINIASQYSSSCFLDTIQILNNDYGLPFNYEWTKGAYIDNAEDIGFLPITVTGLQNYSMNISGFGCSADTTMEIDVYPTVPEVLLSTGDTLNCLNTNVLISANQNVTWFLDGTQQSTSNAFSVWSGAPHTLYGVATNGFGCADTSVEILVDVVTAPPTFHDMDIITPGTNWIAICHPDSIVINSFLDSMIWNIDYISGPLIDYTDTAETITIPVGLDVNGMYVTAITEYQGCNFSKTTNFSFAGSTNLILGANNGTLSIQANTINYFCSFQDSIIVNSNRYLDWSLDGNFITSGVTVDATQSGMYIGTDACGYSQWFEIMNSSISEVTENVETCLGYAYYMPDGTFYTNITASFTHISNIFNSGGCEVTVTTNVTVLSPIESTDLITACISYTWIDGNTYTDNTNTPTWTLVSEAGCDSLITLDLTILDTQSVTDIQSACNDFTWIDGNTYTASTNSPTWTLTNAAGCDSLITLDLTILDAQSVTDIQSACNDFTWIDGNTYTTSTNSPTWTLTNAAGCDSLITLDLTINSLPNMGVSQAGSILSSDQSGANYQWLDCDDNNIPIDGEINQSFTPSSVIGNYSVEIDLNGCIDTSACFVIDYSGISELYTHILYLSPNPANEFVNIEGLEEVIGVSYIQVISSNGKLELQLDGKNPEINVSLLVSGLYFIRIIHDQGIETLRFIKK